MTSEKEIEQIFDPSRIVLNNIRGLNLMATLTEAKETKSGKDLAGLLKHMDEITKAGHMLFIKDSKRNLLLESLLEENANLKAENEKLKKQLEWNKNS